MKFSTPDNDNDKDAQLPSTVDGGTNPVTLYQQTTT